MITTGEQIRLSATIRNTAGQKTDPGVIGLRVMNPAGTITTVTVVSSGTGEYYGVVTVNLKGLWRWRFECTTPAAAEEGHFVAESSF